MAQQPQPAFAGASLSALARADGAIDESVFDGPLVYTIEELAERAGTAAEHVAALARWIGRPPRRTDEVRYTDADVAALRHAIEFTEAENLDPAAAASLVRGISSAMQRLATRQVEAIIQHLAASRGVSDTEARLIAAKFAPPRAAQLAPLVDHVYRRQFAAAVHRLTTDAIAQRGLHGDDADYPLLRAIGFADLVNFTARTENDTAREFADLVRKFTDTTWQIISDGGGRIVNFIGDAVFFAADDLETGAKIALDLAAPGALGPSGPVRVGLVWTRVLTVFGDAFGPGVNLAARLAAAADPSEVYIGSDEAAVLARQPRFTVVAEPAFEAHGIGSVRPFRLRYADDPRGAETASPSR